MPLKRTRTTPQVKARNKLKRSRARVTSATQAAREALTQADVLGLTAVRARIPSATKGVFGMRSLRAAGDLSSYMIGTTQPPPSLPKPPGRKKKPPTGRRPRRR